VELVDHELPVAPVGHEAGRAQQAEVVAGVALREAEAGAQLGHGGRALGEGEHEVEARLVAQQPEEPGGEGDVLGGERAGLGHGRPK
jgi:hypothetical protein